MNCMLRSDGQPDIGLSATSWEYCNIEQLDRHIRTLTAARKWLAAELKRKEAAERCKPKVVIE